MIVLVPFVAGMLHPRVKPSIDSQGYVPFLAEIGGDTGWPSYAELLKSVLLTELMLGNDVAIVEQDVESRPDFLADLEACPEPWCFHAYRFNVPFDDTGVGVTFTPLGHTRLRAELCDVLHELVDTSDWWNLDYLDIDRTMGEALTAAGYKPHRHEGQVIHHHRYG